ncbi:MAG TPA: DUF3159 domain-containing protein [Streptosporangiaceae bacterium]
MTQVTGREEAAGPDRDPNRDPNRDPEREQGERRAQAAEPSQAAAEQPQHGASGTVEAIIKAQLNRALGGKRGVVEGAVPTIAFTVSWIVTHDLRPSLYIGGGAALALLVVRLVQRSTPQFVLNSLIGIALAAFFALRSGKAEDAFLPGMLWTGAASGLMLLSILARWPFVGFLVGAANPEDPLAWRRDPAMVKVCARLSWLLLLPGVIKLAVQIPLYLSAQVAWLGVSKVALGWPVYLGALGLAAVVLMRGNTPHPVRPAAEPPG